MQHRISLFVMFATCLGLCAQTGASVTGLEDVYRGLPGGAEGVPSFTLTVMSVLQWLADWWPICLALSAAVAFGGPVLLQRSSGVRNYLTAADAWLTKYHGTVVVVFVCAMSWTYRAIDLALWLPVTQLFDQLTGG